MGAALLHHFAQVTDEMSRVSEAVREYTKEELLQGDEKLGRVESRRKRCWS